MVVAFAGEFFWKSVRDFRAWIGLVGLVAAGIAGAIGKPIIVPTWVWLLIAFASAILNGDPCGVESLSGC